MKRIQIGLKVLKEIFPPYLLLLIFIPLIIEVFIDHELFDSRNIIINLLWIPLLTIPFILFKKRFLYRLICSIYFIIGLIGISHWIILKGPLTITSLLVISNTNLQEAKEFLDLKASAGLLILIPYVIIFIFSLRYRPVYYKSRIKPFIIGIILLISGLFIFENVINGRLIRKGVPQIAKVTFSFIDKIKLYKEAMQEIEPQNIQANSIHDNSKQTFVLIIGESGSRNHMSLYGYTRKTNPKLENRKDLVVYNNVVSPYSNTLNTILSMLSESNLEQKKEFGMCIDIIDVFHSAGFKTYWISNQSPIGIWDNLVTVFSKKSDYFKYVNTTSNSSFEATTTTSYDSKLFKPFISAMNEDHEKKFIVLHLMGSHSSYKKRYPADFHLFNGTNKKEKTIAEYDNSVLYNDFIVDSLFNILSVNDSLHQNSITSSIYLSDHGENVYDELDRVGHDYSNELPKSNVDVPFIVWLSPKFINLNPNKSTIIKSNQNKPYVSDDLFHSIIDLNGILTLYFNERRSVFNENFNESRQRVLEDGRDYDKK
ncbi:phosphoethanolamine transferase [Bacteroidota bacterium]